MSRSSFVKRVAEMWSAWWAAHWLPPHERSTWAMPIAGRYLVWIFDVETLCPTSLGRRWLAERHRLGDNVVVNGVNWTVRIADEIGCQCLRCLGRRNLVPTPASNTETRSASPLQVAAEVTTPTSPARPGFTLVEMLVVLTILAVLAAVAVTAVEGVGEQARYEATQNTLNNIRTAIVGDPSLKNSDGTRVVSGFLADVGRLPNEIGELLAKPDDLIVVDTATFDSDGDGTNDISLISGWNGPYLHVTTGIDGTRDSWGRQIGVSLPAGTSDPWAASSLGANGVTSVGEMGFDVDLNTAITASERSELVAFRVFAIDPMSGSRIDPTPAPIAPEKIRVLLFGPNVAGGTNGAIQRVALTANPTTFEVGQTLPIGRYATRAVRWSDGNNNDIVDTGETVMATKSYVRHFTVTGSRVGSRIEMELR